MKLSLIMASLALAACTSVPVKQPSLTDLQASVVRVETSSGVCSGWVDQGTHHVITAAHCFDFSPGEAVVTFNDGHQGLYITQKISDDALDASSDHAILVPKEEVKDVPVGLPLCDFKPYYGEPVVMMGNPLGVDHMMNFGHISNPRSSDNVIGVDINLLPGNSGGPVIDMEHGCVIGSAEEIQLAIPGSRIPLGIPYAAPVDNL